LPETGQPILRYALFGVAALSLGYAIRGPARVRIAR
jgi:hypothetical protein